MRLPATSLGRKVIATSVVIAAVAGGVVADRALIGTNAGTTTLSERNGTLQGEVHTGPINGHPPVPFLGPFAYHHKGVTECGPAVRLMEGALKRKKFRKDAPRNCVGPATVAQIKRFQVSLHYRPTGTYNLVTHQAMVKHGGYTNEARRAVVYLLNKRIVARKRHNVSVIVAHAVLVGYRLPYSQSGSRGSFPSWPSVPQGTDCSGFVTWIAWQAGFGAAMGYYGMGSSVGWTGTLNVQGVAVKPNAPLAIGDLVFYPSSSARGPPWGHVAMYVGHGQVVSHGSVGVKLLPYNYRAVGIVRRYLAPPT